MEALTQTELLGHAYAQLIHRILDLLKREPLACCIVYQDRLRATARIRSSRRDVLEHECCVV